MVGITELGAAASGLKTAFDIVQGLHAAAKSAAINQIQIELGGHIVQAQHALTAASIAQATAAERIRELEQHIVQLEHWEAEKQRYQLRDVGQGALAYALKSGVEPSEPPHSICPQCYEDGAKSILKHEHLVAGRAEVLVCHRCGLDLVTSGRRAPPPTVLGGRIAPSTAPGRRR